MQSGKKPLVSVLMSAYNAEPFIEASVRSVLGQSYDSLELVIVNDGSSDGTEDKIKPFLKDDRVRYVSQKNAGVSAARNHAFSLSKGGYITFIDPDDYYSPEKISKEAGFLAENSDYGAVYCRFWSFYDKEPKKLLTYRREFPSGNIFMPLLRHNLINPNTIMMRREVFSSAGGFDPTFRDAEDWDLWLRIAVRGVKFGFLNEPLHYNRLREGSHSRFDNQYKMKLSNLKSFEKISSLLSEDERRRYGIPLVIRNTRLKLALAYVAAKKKKECLSELLSAWPSGLGKLFGYFLCGVVSMLPADLSASIAVSLWRRKQRGLFSD